MKILITGAGGQLGQTLSERLAEVHDTLAFDRQGFDITNLSLIDNIIKETQPDCVINTAAYTAVDKAEDERLLALKINRDGPENLAKICEKYDIPLIHISTDYVFDGEKTSPYTEDDVTNPINVYGESKCLGEEAVRENCRKHIILRVSWVFGVHGHNFVKTIQRLSRELATLNIVSDQQGCPTSTENISTVLLSITEKIKSPGFDSWGTYHYCDTPESNWFEFAKAIVAETQVYETLAIKQLGSKLTVDYPTPAKRPKNSRMNCQKLETQLGIARCSWAKALKQMIKELEHS